jgi:riboflavin synthase
MFTGIVEELGHVASISDLGDAARLVITGPLVTSDTRPGDSIAVNGVCLTVVKIDEADFSADVMLETLRRSSLGALAPGSQVSERAARIGGHHQVQGMSMGPPSSAASSRPTGPP